MGSHRKWRAQAKKMRRKRIRQKLAQERDEIIRKDDERKENSPKYQVWLSEQRALELFAEEEEARLSAEQHAAWLAEEERAQKAWQERQKRLALARAERAKQELRIKEEWEEEQGKLKAAKEEQERIAEQKQLKQEELMRQIENFINKGGDMPPEVNVASVTNPDRPACPFFNKTGACRFGDRCSRNHTRPAISRVLLVPNFYDHIGLRQMNPDELEAADDWLEYEDSETYHHFLDFYEDVLPEWERVGKISQFKVCCNFEPHLRGNVYIEYESAQDAVKAFKTFHGRFYGGKQINVEFVNVDSWKAAICGQFHKHCCPKGRACNFLHVFRNPGNAFHAADRDQQDWRRKQKRGQSPSPHRGRDRSWSGSPENNSRRRNWRWSASPSPPPDHHNSSSHRQNSVRSHRSEREEAYSRRRSSRRRDEHSSSRRRCPSSERSQAKILNSEHSEQTELSPRRDSRRSSKKEAKYFKRLAEKVGSSHRSRNSVEVSPDEKRYLGRDIGSVDLRNISGCETLMSEKDRHCDTSCNSPKGNTVVEAISSASPSSLPNKHTYFEDESGEDIKSVEKSNHKQKGREKKSKKRKKKDSHRKEKKRKKKSTNRSVSCSSSESD